MRILPGNVQAWEVIRYGASQWRSGFRGHYGLDLPALKLVARTLGIPWTRDLMDRILIFEDAALKVFRGEKFCDVRKQESCSLKYGPNLEWACKQNLCGEKA